MSINFVVSLFVLVIGYLLPDSKSNKKWFVCILAIVLIFLNALRPIEMTTKTSNDTYRYYLSYQDIIHQSWNELISNFSFHGSDYRSRDSGYPIFMKATQLITTNFTAYLFIVACIVVIPILRIINTYTTSIKGVVTAVLIYESLFAGFFETGIRQTIVMGLLLMGYNWVLNKKWVRFSILVLFASTIHSSAWIFLPMVFLPYLEKPKKKMLYMLVLTPLIMVFAKDLIAFLGSDTMYESYAVDSEYNQGTPVFSLLLVLIGIVTYVSCNRILAYYPNDSKVALLAVGVAVVLMPSSWIDSSFIRIVFYYAIFILPVIPMCIESLFRTNDKRASAYLFVNLALLILMLR